MALLDTIVPNLLQLTSRSVNENAPGNKTPADFAKEGRYNYAASFAAAIVFLVLFGIALAMNIVQFFWHRAWFWWVMIFAVTCKCKIFLLSRTVTYLTPSLLFPY